MSDFHGHDVVVWTDGGKDFPLIRGVEIDGHQFVLPEDSTVAFGVAVNGTMTATITVFVRTFNTVVKPTD